MSKISKKNMFLVGFFILFVIFPISFISFGEYNFSSSLNRAEQKEFLQVIYSLSASMFILLYYGVKWLLRKDNGIITSLIVLNILGFVSLYLFLQTMENNLLMEPDFYYLIVYSEIVIIHLTHHIFTKTSVI